MINCQEDAKQLLQEQGKSRSWGEIEAGLWELAVAQSQEEISELLGWYQKDAERVVYLGKAAGEQRVLDGAALLQLGQTIWLHEQLLNAFEELVQEREDQRIEEAQAENIK